MQPQGWLLDVLNDVESVLYVLCAYCGWLGYQGVQWMTRWRSSWIMGDQGRRVVVVRTSLIARRPSGAASQSASQPVRQPVRQGRLVLDLPGKGRGGTTDRAPSTTTKPHTDATPRHTAQRDARRSRQPLASPPSTSQASSPPPSPAQRSRHPPARGRNRNP